MYSFSKIPDTLNKSKFSQNSSGFMLFSLNYDQVLKVRKGDESKVKRDLVYIFVPPVNHLMLSCTMRQMLASVKVD